MTGRARLPKRTYVAEQVTCTINGHTLTLRRHVPPFRSPRRGRVEWLELQTDSTPVMAVQATGRNLTAARRAVTDAEAAFLAARARGIIVTRRPDVEPARA